MHDTRRMPGQLLSTSEVATLLGVERSVITRRVQMGRLPIAQKLPGPNGAYLFDPDVIEALRDQPNPAVADNHTYQDSEAAS